MISFTLVLSKSQFRIFLYYSLRQGVCKWEPWNCCGSLGLNRVLKGSLGFTIKHEIQAQGPLGKKRKCSMNWKKLGWWIVMYSVFSQNINWEKQNVEHFQNFDQEGTIAIKTFETKKKWLYSVHTFLNNIIMYQILLINLHYYIFFHLFSF